MDRLKRILSGERSVRKLDFAYQNWTIELRDIVEQILDKCPIDEITKIKIILPENVLVGIINLCLSVRHVDKITFDIDIPDYVWKDRLDTVSKCFSI